MEGIPHLRLTLEICPVSDERIKVELENDQVVDMVGSNVNPFLQPTVFNGDDKHGNRKRVQMEKAELPQDQKQLLIEPKHNSEDVKIKVENDNGANESRNVSSSQVELPLISTAEEKLSTQRQHISPSKFPKAVDRCNSAKFHGLKDISLGEKMKLGRKRTYECFCGPSWTSYTTFRKHYNNEILVDRRCPFCTKKFKEESTLQEHCSRRHGNTFNPDQKREEEAKVQQGEIESNIDQVEPIEELVNNPGEDNGTMARVEDADESAVRKKVERLEKRIPSQMKHFFGKFTPAKDVANPSKFHGLTEIVSKGKLEGNRLLKSYN